MVNLSSTRTPRSLSTELLSSRSTPNLHWCMGLFLPRYGTCTFPCWISSGSSGPNSLACPGKPLILHPKRYVVYMVRYTCSYLWPNQTKFRVFLKTLFTTSCSLIRWHILFLKPNFTCFAGVLVSTHNSTAVTGKVIYKSPPKLDSSYQLLDALHALENNTKSANINHILQQHSRAKVPGPFLYWTFSTFCCSEAATPTVPYCKNLD